MVSVRVETRDLQKARDDGTNWKPVGASSRLVVCSGHFAAGSRVGGWGEAGRSLRGRSFVRLKYRTAAAFLDRAEHGLPPHGPCLTPCSTAPERSTVLMESSLRLLSRCWRRP